MRALHRTGMAAAALLTGLVAACDGDSDGTGFKAELRRTQ
jgi:hypothetical protein